MSDQSREQTATVAASSDCLAVLGDGRRLGYMEFGRPEGRPVILFHGLPGSRLPTGAEHSLAAAGDLRLVTVDRPGFGRSSHDPNRTIGDWPPDVAGLADQLGLDNVSVIGVSAGGAYALACGQQWPERLDGLVLVNSMVPLDLPGASRRFDPSRRFGYWLMGNVPGQSRWVAWLQARAVRSDPATLVRRISSRMSEADRKTLSDQSAVTAALPHLAEAYRDGSAGVAHELRLLSRPWGIPLDQIDTEVRMFHGELDRNVPVGAARLLAEALPNCRITVFPNEGHLSSPEALRHIVSALGPT